ncbi:uncharacterized protein LOC144861252 [Branchiostoma floridae x Branchiostoma japonicum]
MADHKDMTAIFNKIDCDVTKLFPNDHRKQLLWKIQQDHVINKRNEWNTEFLDICLQLWQRTKEGYGDLQSSGFLTLPSQRLLRYRKNKVPQKPGLQTDVLEWMGREAEQQDVSERGHHGFIVFDEMKIQGSVQLRRLGDEYEIAGLVDLGAFYSSMRSLQTGGEQKAEMATHIFQMAFKGCEGFFFPFAWYPTTEIAPINIFHHHWDSVFHLQQHGFFTHACLCDGGQANRDFMIGHFGSKEEAIAQHFTIHNLYGEGNYSFIMDPPHNIKKLRNNIEKSTLGGTARCFKLRGKHILWSHLKEAYVHDKTNARGPLTSYKIRDNHFQLTPATRMRNHLAADIFSDEMIELLDNYQEYKKDQKGDVDSMCMTREYLASGNVLVKTFANTKPIRNTDDPRLVQLDGALQWFLDWKEEITDGGEQTAKEKNKSYISDKLHFDLCSMVLGFKSYVKTMETQFPGRGLVSAGTNQDALENMFGCVRASNGSNTNPTVLQYGPSVNGYIHCRSFKIRNGNASRRL